MLDHSHDLQLFRRLMDDGELAVKALGQAAFELTLVPHEVDPALLSLFDSLCGLVSGGVRTYIECLEEARDLTPAPDRSDLERLLVAVDRLVALEDHYDTAERTLLERLVRESSDFRQLYLLSTIATRLDAACDSIVRSGLLVRDYVLGIAPRM
jgi:hypothetical protein